jgi:hypothetical protein
VAKRQLFTHLTPLDEIDLAVLLNRPRRMMKGETHTAGVKAILREKALLRWAKRRQERNLASEAAWAQRVRKRKRGVMTVDERILRFMADGNWRGSADVRLAVELKKGTASPRVDGLYRTGFLERAKNDAFDDTKHQCSQSEPMYLYRITEAGLKRWAELSVAKEDGGET